MIPPKRFPIFPPDWGMLRRSRCVQIFIFKYTVYTRYSTVRVQQREQKEQMARTASRGASTYLGAIRFSVHLAPVQGSFGSSTMSFIGVASHVLRCFGVLNNFFPSLVASLFSWRCLAAPTSLFFLPRGHKPPPTLRDRLNPHLCLQRCRFPLRCQASGHRSVRMPTSYQ